MIWTDTHTHLYSQEFASDRAEGIRKAIDAGITRLFMPNIEVGSIQPMLDVVWEFPGNCFPMMGLHPCSVDANYADQLFQIRKWFDKREFYAVGEIGLDYYWSREFDNEQVTAFKKQLEWSVELDLPVVIHSRNATDEIIGIIRAMNEPRVRGIFHCFSGTAAQAAQIVEMGFFLGIGGVLTFKNSGLDTALANVSLEHIVLETDAPYLAPVPFRGKRNESAYLTLIAQKLADLKGISLEKVAEVTTANSKKVFGI